MSENLDEVKSVSTADQPTTQEIWAWWSTQKFQKEENHEQEYTMLFELDLPKILAAYHAHFVTQKT